MNLEWSSRPKSPNSVFFNHFHSSSSSTSDSISHKSQVTAYCLLSVTTRKSHGYRSSDLPKRLKEGNRMKEDLISQLPDAILISIVGRMVTEDAVRTSTLSKRWRNLYKFVPNVNLWCRCLVEGGCPHDMNTFINEADRFLRLRSGFKIRSLMLNCCLMKSNTDRFEQFMFSLGRFSVERLLLVCSLGPHGDFSFSCNLISQMPSLTFLSLWFGSLLSNNNNNNNYSSISLQVLRLNGVTVLDGALECFLSNCSSLHSLSIGICKLPSKLFIRGGPNLQLKNLMIDGGGTDEIEFYAPNLVNYEFTSDRVVNFVFCHVPKLQNVFLDFQNKSTMSYVCTKLVKDLPHLKSLMFATKGHDIYQVSNRTIGGFNTFADLRKLSLSLYSTDGVNLILLVPFLQMCPLLQEFHMNTKCVEYVDRREVMDVELVIHHPELKKVEISGHGGTQAEIEFALYILKSATSLEEMQIIRCPKSYKGCGRWNVQDEAPWGKEALEMIHGQLQGQAISNNARLAIQHRPLYENNWRKYYGPIFGNNVFH